MKSQRRSFIIKAVGTGAAAALGTQAAFAQTPALPIVKDTDPKAIALGYKTDGTKTDTKKFPKYSKDQICANCALWVGDVKAPHGKCALFPGQLVANKAWCSAWVKKA